MTADPGQQDEELPGPGPSDWERLDGVFEAALELPSEQREHYVREACGDDLALLREVEGLLSAAATSGGLLEGPPPLLRHAFAHDGGASRLNPAEEPGSAPDPHDTIGAYRLLEQLGVGGMGTVYLAERADGHFEQRVALKVMREGALGVGGVRRFLQERQILARLQHPNIARLYDGGLTPDGRPYFVMELVEGSSITDFCRREGLSQFERVRLFEDLVRAVDYAHREGVIHRDLKPSNMLVTRDGRAVLLDFGIATVLDAEHSPALTQSGHTVLTPVYASPEQLKGQTVTSASDVYQLGVVLYELIAGRTPLGDAPDPPGVVAGRRRATDLDRICAKALNVAPEARYPSTTAFAEDLVRYREGRPVHARSATPAYVMSRFLGRHPLGVVMAAGLAGASLAGGLLIGRGLPSGADLVALWWLALPIVLALLLVFAWALPRLRDSSASAAEARPAPFDPQGPERPSATDHEGSSPHHDERTVAVLPFEILGDGKDTDPFAAGLHDDLVTELSRVASLTVISRSSVAPFSGHSTPVSEIGRQLGAGTIVEGTLQRAGERVRLNVQVTDVHTEAHRWAERYDRKLTAVDIFELQSELARRIANTVLARLTSEGTNARRQAPTDNLEAFRLYAQGRSFFAHRSHLTLERAVASFEAAVEHDSEYALAWAWMAVGLVFLGEYGHVDTADVFPRAEEAARRALDLDPTLAEGHSALGYLHTARREISQAIARHSRAVALVPGFARGHNGLCWARLLTGDAEGSLDAGLQTLRYDPLDTETRADVSVAHLGLGNVAEGLRQARRAREAGFEGDFPRWTEGLALFHSERHEEAKDSMLDLSESWTRLWPEAATAITHIRAGDRASAERVRAGLAKEAGGAFFIGLIHGALGEPDPAFEAFAAAAPMGWPETLYFRYPPPGFLDRVVEDPRYGKLLEALDRSWGVSANSV